MTTELLEVINWQSLPSWTRPIASMLASGLTQRQIAERLNVAESKIASAVDELRAAIAVQALEHRSALPADLVARLERARGSTA